MKLLCGIVLLALIQFSLAGRGVGASNIVQNRNSGSTSHGPTQVIYRPPVINRYTLGQKIDAFIRQKFWYYLPDCHLTYLAHLEIIVGCQYLLTYQNYIGTFLAVVTYSDHFGETHVETFVRLGDGIKSIDDIAKPINVQAVVIQLDLGDGQYFVSEAEYKAEAFRWEEKYIVVTKVKSRRDQIQLQDRCARVQKYIKKQYWYYLTDDTVTLNLHSSRSRHTCYCSFTFLNYVGLWQVVGAWNDGPIVRTFVRLGQGSDPQNVQMPNHPCICMIPLIYSIPTLHYQKQNPLISQLNQKNVNH